MAALNGLAFDFICSRACQFPPVLPDALLASAAHLNRHAICRLYLPIRPVIVCFVPGRIPHLRTILSFIATAARVRLRPVLPDDLLWTPFSFPAIPQPIAHPHIFPPVVRDGLGIFNEHGVLV